MIDLREKPGEGEAGSPWYNAGSYTFRPSIFEFTARLKPSPRGEYELTDAIRELAQSGKTVKAIELSRRMGRRARPGNPRSIESGTARLLASLGWQATPLIYLALTANLRTG